MTKFKPALLAILSTAVIASPVAAGGYDWSFTNVCGGTDFQTCISGGVYVSGNTIVVDITNVGPGVMTSVGLWNLPKVGNVTTLPDTAWTDAAGSWKAPDNDLNGVVSPAQRRYSVGTDDGINSGIAVGGASTFYFHFTVDPSTFVNDIGVGAHMQGLQDLTGRDCSSKVYTRSDGTSANTWVPNDRGCGASVPEPSSLLLLGTGMAGLAFIRRRRRNGVELVDEDGNDVEI